MGDALLLANAVRHYAWGSTTVLPALLGLPTPAVEPWAEIWIGAHPSDPSLLPDGRSLADVEPGLSYLVKLLAADLPLSIQAHPGRDDARQGYARDEAAGIPATAAERSYKDANHKPELLVALQRTEALCGFRTPAEILGLAARLGSAAFSRLAEPLSGGSAPGEVFAALVRLAGQPLTDLLDDVARAAKAADSPESAWVLRLLELYPSDPGVVAPLLLRLVVLDPGDGLFVASGVLHAYLHGAGVEVQASSDNVLRAGLTHKPVDLPGLLRVMRVDGGPAPLVHPVQRAPGLDEYAVPVDDFAVWRASPAGAAVLVPAVGPRVVVCVEGVVVVGGQTLRAGEAAYLPREAAELSVAGSGTAFITATPADAG